MNDDYSGEDVEVSEGVYLDGAENAPDDAYEELETIDPITEDDTLTETDGGEQSVDPDIINENVATLDTTVNVVSGDRVIITLIDGEPVVTGVVGGGDNMAADVQSALSSAEIAAQAAADAQGSATAAQNSATAAANAASVADGKAVAAASAAAAAQDSAKEANNGLSEVEKVVGTLNWIADHGRYVNQAGQTFDATKIYYTRSGTSPNYVYTMVDNPVAADIASYYILVIDESVQNFIASHVYLLNDSLSVTTDSTTGYKVRIDGDSVDVLNTSGTVVATFGTTARIGAATASNILLQSSGINFYSQGAQDPIVVINEDGIYYGDENGSEPYGNLTKYGFMFSGGENTSVSITPTFGENDDVTSYNLDFCADEGVLINAVTTPEYQFAGDAGFNLQPYSPAISFGVGFDNEGDYVSSSMSLETWGLYCSDGIEAGAYSDKRVTINNGGDGYIRLTNDNIDITESDNNVSATTSEVIRFEDTGGRAMGYVQGGAYTSGATSAQLAARNYGTGSSINNALTLYVYNDGSRGVTFSERAPWLSALNIGTTKTNDISSAVSVATQTYKSIGSLSLESGNWVITYGASFASNSTGRRFAFLYTSSDTAGSASWNRATLIEVNAVNGGATYVHGSFIVNPSSTTSYYLTCWQNSGSSLSCNGYMRAMKIG